MYFQFLLLYSPAEDEYDEYYEEEAFNSYYCIPATDEEWSMCPRRDPFQFLLLYSIQS